MAAFSQSDIARLLEQPFNLTTLERLEAFVSAQVADESDQSYDFEANKAVLKNYQMDNSKLKVEFVVSILLLSLLKLPKTDYLALTYIVNPRAAATPQVKAVAKVADLLERGSFREFWAELATEETAAVFAQIPRFGRVVRSFILGGIKATFKNIPVATFLEFMNIDAAGLAALLASDPSIGQVKQLER
jgi:CSN8/PSMD8/EIF3K family